MPGLLERDLGASFFKLLLERVGVGLGQLLLDDLGCAFNEVLGFLEAQTRDFAHNLDDVELLCTTVCELDVKFRLLFGSCSSTGSRSTGSHHDRGGSRNTKLIFKGLLEFSGFDEGQRANLLNEFFNDCGHVVLRMKKCCRYNE